MFDDQVYSLSAIIIPTIAVIIYLYGYIKLKWEFLWIGFAGACLSSISGFDSVYESIDYDNPDMVDYLLDSMWIVGWGLEVLCLFLIIKKVIEVQSKRENDNPVKPLGSR